MSAVRAAGFLTRAYLRRIRLDLWKGGGLRAFPPFSTPIDYTRFREFAFGYEEVRAAARTGSRLLDVGSPKTFPLALAAAFREVEVTALDIVHEEVAWLALRAGPADNGARPARGDVRALPFADASFDLATSISALEHVAPEDGGDAAAVRELARVLRPGGRLVATLPFAPAGFVEHQTGAVYERTAAAGEAIFFQRFYDEAGLRRLFGGVPGLETIRFDVIHERLAREVSRRWARVFTRTPRRARLVAPLYPLLGHLLLSAPRPLGGARGRPYLACVVCRKRS